MYVQTLQADRDQMTLTLKSWDIVKQINLFKFFFFHTCSQDQVCSTTRRD